MKKYLIVTLILASTVFPALYLCGKNISYFGKLEANSEMVNAIERFASKVESGELTNQEIANRLKSVAKSEENMSTGYGLLKESFYFWIVAFVFITIFQYLMLRKLLKL